MEITALSLSASNRSSTQSLKSPDWIFRSIYARRVALYLWGRCEPATRILLVKLKLDVVRPQDSPPAPREVSNNVEMDQTRQGI